MEPHRPGLAQTITDNPHAYSKGAVAWAETELATPSPVQAPQPQPTGPPDQSSAASAC